jgi:hypothetical protein
MPEYYPRVYPDGIPEYTVLKNNTTSNLLWDLYAAEYVLDNLVDKIQNTSEEEGKFNLVRELFEYHLTIANLLASNERYRCVVIDKCTDVISDTMTEERFHPDDKHGLITLMTAVMRLCMSYGL